MARGRMLNQRITLSQKFDAVERADEGAALLYALLLTFADRDGRVEGNPSVVKSRCYPQWDEMPKTKVEKRLQLLHDAGLIVWYSVDGEQFVQFVKFAEGQENMRYDREAKSVIPPYSGSTPEASGSTPGEEKRREEKIKRNLREENGVRTATRFTPPTLDQVKEFAMDQGFFGFDAEHFVDHFTSNGWKVGGKAPMKDWKASVRNWHRNDVKRSGKPAPRTDFEKVEF